jgi:hypothetical protein
MAASLGGRLEKDETAAADEAQESDQEQQASAISEDHTQGGGYAKCCDEDAD